MIVSVFQRPRAGVQKTGKPSQPMQNKLFVGNLSFQTTEGVLMDAFAQYGTVTDCFLMTDKATGRSRGFAFITMTTDEEAEASIQGLNGKDLDGWKSTVKTKVWGAEKGVLYCEGGGGGYLMTEKEFGDYELRLEYKMPKGGNSGVGIRT
ncbi:MAG: family 16 glycoside hydrolase, partial [Chthoniobacteraceae bacterium]